MKTLTETPVVARTPAGTWVYGVIFQVLTPDCVQIVSWKGTFEAAAWLSCRHPQARRFKRGQAWDLTRGLEWAHPEQARELLSRCNVFPNRTLRQQRARQQLRAMAEQPETALQIKQALDQDPELRDILASLYVRALRTLEQAGWREWVPYCARCAQPWDRPGPAAADVMDCLQTAAPLCLSGADLTWPLLERRDHDYHPQGQIRSWGVVCPH
ncbi:MAG: hypothetical protein U1F76_28300 [Candidatus Competibacteraceae bacterium]